MTSWNWAHKLIQGRQREGGGSGTQGTLVCPSQINISTFILWKAGGFFFTPWVEALYFPHDGQEYSSLYEMRLDKGVDKYTQDNAYYCVNRKAKRHETDKGRWKENKQPTNERSASVSSRAGGDHFFISSNIDTQAEERGQEWCWALRLGHGERGIKTDVDFLTDSSNKTTGSFYSVQYCKAASSSCLIPAARRTDISNSNSKNNQNNNSFQRFSLLL